MSNKTIHKVIDKNQIYLDVAKLHIDTIKTGFLPTLGIKFLALMYKCIDEAKFSILITNYKDYKLRGFVSGTLGTSNLFKAMLSHPLDLIFVLIPLIFQINKIKKIVNILRYTSDSKRSKFPKSELLTICVHPKYHRQGIGIDLYKKLSKFFKSESVSEFVIIVGQSLNANSFYKKQGAKIVTEIQIHSNINSNLLIQKVN